MNASYRPPGGSGGDDIRTGLSTARLLDPTFTAGITALKLGATWPAEFLLGLCSDLVSIDISSVTGIAFDLSAPVLSFDASGTQLNSASLEPILSLLASDATANSHAWTINISGGPAAPIQNSPPSPAFAVYEGQDSDTLAVSIGEPSKYILLPGDKYIYFTVDGVGDDPAPASAGLVIDLPSGLSKPDAVAAITAASGAAASIGVEISTTGDGYNQYTLTVPGVVAAIAGPSSPEFGFQGEFDGKDAGSLSVEAIVANGGTVTL